MKKTQLQLALDFLEFSRALEMAKASVPHGVDIIEAGTPLIKSEGLDCVRNLRSAFPNSLIVADMKTMDAGKIETECAAKAGANYITVSGTASPSTIVECVESAKHYGIKVAIDLLGVKDPAAFVPELEKMGVHQINVHCPIDAQMQGEDPLATLILLRPITSLPIAVAGGLNSETSAKAVEAGADIVIIGGAITKAVNPGEATGVLRKVLDTGVAVETQLFKRSKLDIRDILSKVSTSNISDGTHRQPCLEGIRPLLTGLFACGPAVTVKTMPGDWAKPVQAIDVAKPGEIIVIDACGQPPALWGELATESAKGKGIAGVVVNGAVRDTHVIREHHFPVWSKQVTSHAGDPHGLGEINIPIVISGQLIEPGDWIVADDDGVMVLPAAKAAEMANRALNVLEAENRIRQEIIDHASTLAKVVNLSKWEKKGGFIAG
ncbi:MAG: orotidine 5'-phosphate decarboxylase [Spirochaetales bacterium]|nr:orotidine 5'-phosphate decarboxylase [Spirochaetales bacterium]